MGLGLSAVVEVVVVEEGGELLLLSQLSRREGLGGMTFGGLRHRVLLLLLYRPTYALLPPSQKLYIVLADSSRGDFMGWHQMWSTPTPAAAPPQSSTSLWDAQPPAGQTNAWASATSSTTQDGQQQGHGQGQQGGGNLMGSDAFADIWK